MSRGFHHCPAPFRRLAAGPDSVHSNRSHSHKYWTHFSRATCLSNILTLKWCLVRWTNQDMRNLCQEIRSYDAMWCDSSQISSILRISGMCVSVSRHNNIWHRPEISSFKYRLHFNTEHRYRMCRNFLVFVQFPNQTLIRERLVVWSMLSVCSVWPALMYVHLQYVSWPVHSRLVHHWAAAPFTVSLQGISAATTSQIASQIFYLDWALKSKVTKCFTERNNNSKINYQTRFKKQNKINTTN